MLCSVAVQKREPSFTVRESPLISIVSAKWNCRFRVRSVAHKTRRPGMEAADSRCTPGYTTYTEQIRCLPSRPDEGGRRVVATTKTQPPHYSRYVFSSRERRRYTVFAVGRFNARCNNSSPSKRLIF